MKSIEHFIFIVSIKSIKIDILFNAKHVVLVHGTQRQLRDNKRSIFCLKINK